MIDVDPPQPSWQGLVPLAALALVVGIGLIVLWNRQPALKYASLALLLTSAGIVLLFPLFARPTRPLGVQCLSHVKRASLALLIYAGDYDDHLPPSPAWWRDGVASYASNAPFLGCPSAKSFPGYALNSAIGNVPLSTIDSPGKTIMVFESDLPPPGAIGSEADMSFRHGSKKDYGYLSSIDSSVRGVKSGSAGSYIWTPKLNLSKRVPLPTDNLRQNLGGS